MATTVEKPSRIPTSQKFWLEKLPLGICGLLYFFHFWKNYKYAVNLPFWDEWSMLTPSALGSYPSTSWLMAFYNEHRIVPTKVLMYVFYALNGWNVRTSILLNWLIFGLLIVVFHQLCQKIRQGRKSTVAWFYIFLFSLLPVENYMWSFQSCFHFFLLFFMASILILFRPQNKIRDVLLGALSCILCMFSLASGLGCVLAVSVLFNVWQLQTVGVTKDSKIKLLLFNGLILLGYLVWFQYDRDPSRQFHLVFPNRSIFYNFYLNVLSLGFGVQKVSVICGAFFLLWLLTPLPQVWGKFKARLSTESWMLLAAIGGLIGALAVITLGRAVLGMGQSKATRYAEIGMFLIPLSILVWETYLHKYSRIKYGVVSFFGILMMVSFSNKWNFRAYRDGYAVRKLNLDCIRKYYQGGNPGICPDLYPAPLNVKLDWAKDAGISFYNDLQIGR